MMEAVRTSETSVDNHFTRQYIPEDNSEHHTRRRENLKFHKEGDLRFGVDCRKLNDVTKMDCFPLPRIDDTLNTLTGASRFSTLDLKSGICRWPCILTTKRRRRFAQMAVHGDALLPFQRPSNIRTANGIRPERPDA
jgi:hypothetical protein